MTYNYHSLKKHLRIMNTIFDDGMNLYNVKERMHLDPYIDMLNLLIERRSR